MAEVSEERRPNPDPINIGQLTVKLDAAHIDYSGWGTTIPGSKPIEKLLAELNNGDCYLVSTPEGGLMRQIEQVAVHVYARDDEGRILKLREDLQVFPGGRERKRAMDVSFREKLDQRTEGFNRAVTRGLREELPQIFTKLKYDPNSMYEGIHHIGTHRPTTILDESQPGYMPSYPGLRASSLEHRYTMLIKPGAYDPKGYTTNEDGKITYFVWEEVGAADEPFLPLTVWGKMNNQQQVAKIEAMRERIGDFSGLPEAAVAEYLVLKSRFDELYAMEYRFVENDSLELEFALTDFRLIDIKREYPQLDFSARTE